MTIQPLTPIALGYVLGRMREADRLEVDAIYGDLKPETLAQACLQGEAWACTARDEVVAAFGYKPRSRFVVEAWCLGTDRIVRGMPEITAFIKSEFPRQWARAGIHVCEVRSIMSHRAAHLWLATLGFKYVAVLKDQGEGGENVALMTWRRPWTA
jgi:hypothetical protein